MGLQKSKNEQISVDHICGKHAVGAKTPGNVPFFLVRFFFGATYGNEVISVGGHKKIQTYGTVHAFRLRGRDVPKVGLIFKLMCPIGYTIGGPHFQINVPYHIGYTIGGPHFQISN